jgi:putative ABC transport system permease protein
MWLETLRLARRAIARNGLRSLLTSLGIVIGVAAVIALLTIGAGAAERVHSELSRLGSNLLLVVPDERGPQRAGTPPPPFTARDVEALRAQLRSVRAVAPVSEGFVTAVRGSESRPTSLIGTDGGYLVTQDWALASGRSFSDAELRAGRSVCLLGDSLREQLFGARADPLGQRLRLEKVSCTVIGVLERKGGSGMGQNQDEVVLIPLRAYQRRFAGNQEIGRIHVSARLSSDTARVQGQIEALLRERRRIGPGKPADFAVHDLHQLIQTMSGAARVLAGLLGVIAAVSLLVGGIGIMNIMLVSVTERTREIGIRLAVGALEGHVLLQFLAEAVLLSLVGAIAGVGLGLGLAALACQLLALPFAVDPRVVALAFAVSAGIGVTFGYLPARRAARLDPIRALRRE